MMALQTGTFGEPPGVHWIDPMVIVEGKGLRVVDINGKEYFNR